MGLVFPLPRAAAGRAVAVNKALVRRFAAFGADPAAVDVSRILRVVGTTNSKSGERTEILWLNECDGRVHPSAGGERQAKDPFDVLEGRVPSFATPDRGSAATGAHVFLVTERSRTNHGILLTDTATRVADCLGDCNQEMPVMVGGFGSARLGKMRTRLAPRRSVRASNTRPPLRRLVEYPAIKYAKIPWELLGRQDGANTRQL